MKAALAVLLAPLVGSVVWLAQTVVKSAAWAKEANDPSLDMSTSLFSDPLGVVQVLAVGWIYGLIMTVIVGLPLGFAIAAILRKLGQEGLLQYLAASALTAFLFSLALPNFGNFKLAVTLTGLLLGASYWFFIRRPVLRSPEPSHA